MDMGRFNPKKLNEGEVKEQYQVTVKNKSATLEDNGDINSTWDTVRDGIIILAKKSISHCESKHHKP
jgi:hypothetical protein